MAGYGSIVQEYNDMIQTQQNRATEAAESGISDNMNTALSQFKENADEYAHKYSAMAEGGVGELMGMAGLSGAYEKYKKIMKIKGDLEKKTQNLRDRLGQNDDPEKAVGGDEIQMSEIGEVSDDFATESRAVERLRQGRSADVDVGEPEVPNAEGTTNPFADAVRLKQTQAPKGDADLTSEDLDDIVSRNIQDTSEGVGRELTNIVDTSDGFTTGLTGRGGSTLEEARALSRAGKPAPDGDSVSIFDSGVESQRATGSVRQALVNVESEVRSNFTTTEPIDVQGLGVKRSARLFDEGQGGGASASDQSLDLATEGARTEALQNEVRQQISKLPQSDQEAFARRVGQGKTKPVESMTDEELENARDVVNFRLSKQPTPEAETRPPPAERNTEFDEEDEIQPYQKPADEEANVEADTPKAEADTDVVKPVVDDVAKEATEGVGEQLGEDAAKVGAGIGEDFVEDEVAGSLFGPVGEAVGAVVGVATAIDGLVHLFTHHSSAPTAPTNLGNLDPQISSRLSSKYANGIPTIDSAHEVSASVSSF